MSPDPEDYDDLDDDNPDGYDRNGVLGADGNVYSDADPGL
jgi:hypothetical protein